MKYFFYLYCFLFVQACKDNPANFNNQLVQLHSSVQSKWLYVAETITHIDSISSKEMDMINDLQHFIEQKIEAVHRISPNRDGANFKKAILDQMNYLAESCKAYKKIFGKQNKKFTKQEANEWLQENHNRYLYYDNVARDAQEEFIDATKTTPPILK